MHPDASEEQAVEDLELVLAAISALDKDKDKLDPEPLSQPSTPTSKQAEDKPAEDCNGHAEGAMLT